MNSSALKASLSRLFFHPRGIRTGWACAGLLLAAGCAVGPDYKRPSTAVPVTYKENSEWKVAAPDDKADRGAWWRVFNDAQLDDLETQVPTSNQTVLQADATYQEARQVARADRTTYWPTIGATAAAQRTSGVVESAALVGRPSTTLYTAELQGSWAPDFWGKVRRTVEADVATAQADSADLASAILSLQATLAEDYVQLRSSDEKIRLLENAVEAYRRTLKITQNKYAVGVSARSDIITAQTELDSTRAQLIDTGIQRAQFEHAIAVLVGKAPEDFSIVRTPAMGLATPPVPPQLASQLLERRPDIAAAERLAAAANARIGIQTAAYYPAFSLSASGGYEGSPINRLITTPFRFWTLGAEATDTLLDWGQRHDLVLSARAAYDASAANYRETVLTALQQVEDGLAGIRILNQESDVQDTAVKEASQAAQIALNEYNAGTVDFTTVVAAQVTELTNRETALAIAQNRLTTSVALIQALGGGWTTDDLPKPRAVVH